MHRIPLANTEFEGKNNIYLFDEGDRTALIDAGYGIDEIRAQLETGLADHGVTFEDVTDVFVTHWHHDHAGMAGIIQEASEATIYAHPGDADLLTGDRSAWRYYEGILEDRFEAWEMPNAKRTELLDLLGLSDRNLGKRLSNVEAIEDGQRFDLGDTTLETVHLPGHTAGLCGFAVSNGDGGEELFSSDALLPQYTPNVGGADMRLDDPLGLYLDSLHRIVDRGFSKAWPGHRDPIDDPSARAADIISHHDDRMERVFNTVRDAGPIDVWSISAELFGSLSGVHIIHGPGEVYAHLAHLESHDLVDRTEDGYVCSDPDASVDAAIS